MNDAQLKSAIELSSRVVWFKHTLHSSGGREYIAYSRDERNPTSDPAIDCVRLDATHPGN